MKKHRFEALDGMRGFAALAVLLFHVSKIHAPWVFPHGYLAVDFFFILSGFVVAHAYEDRLSEELTIRRFLYSRFVRLYPLILAGAVVGLIGFSKLYNPSVLASIFVTGLLLLPTPFAPQSEAGVALPINPPSWSLFFEAAINIVFAIISPKLSNRALICLLVVSALALLITIVAFEGANFGSFWTNFGAGGVRVCFSFFCGVGLSRLWLQKRLSRYRIAFPTLLAGLALLLLVPDRPSLNVFFDSFAILVAFPLIVACGANANVQNLSRPVCLICGELSYPVYVLQGGVATHIRDLPDKVGAHGFMLVLLSVFMVAAYIAFCWLVLKFYDQPVRLFLSRKSVSRHDVKPVAVTAFHDPRKARSSNRSTAVSVSEPRAERSL